eukprot:jgi/Botrbrau1/11057/Bobra.0302s0002.2
MWPTPVHVFCIFLACAGRGYCTPNGTEVLEEEEYKLSYFGLRQRADENTTFVPNSQNLIAAASIATAALLANSAGIGGGPLFLPILVNVLGFSVRTATFLSHTIVSSSAVGSTISGLWQTSPRDPTRPLTDLDLALLIIPSLLLGVSIGVVFNTIFPEWLQIVLLTVLLVPVIFNTFKKAKKLRQSEQKELNRGRLNLVSDGLAAPQTPDHNILRNDTPLLLESDSEGSDDEVVLDEGFLLKATSLRRREAAQAAAAAVQAAEVGQPRPHTTLQKLAAFKHRFPAKQFGVIFVLWLAFLAFQIGKARVHKCSEQYWLLFGGQVAMLVATTALVVWIQYRDISHGALNLSPEIRALLGAGDDHGCLGKAHAGWALAALTALVCTSGIFAGCLGIGGAVLFGPLLINQGVHPQVTLSHHFSFRSRPPFSCYVGKRLGGGLNKRCVHPVFVVHNRHQRVSYWAPEHQLC